MEPAAITEKRKTPFTPDGLYRFDLGDVGLLGSGAHGVVRAATHVHTGQMVAIKVMTTTSLTSVAKELAAHGRLRHPHIVELKATMVDLDRNRVYMVMELCRGGELFDRIAECGKVEEQDCQRYLFQMASALSHCHARNVFHRDLKPENILLDEFDNVKVCDFGLAATMHQVHEDASFLRHTKCGSLMYAAPEVLTSSVAEGYAVAKADVWSLGVIMYAMLSGALPFQAAHPSKCRRFAIVAEHGILPLCQVNNFSAAATQLLCGMLSIDPAKRFTIDQVLESEWLRPMREQQVQVQASCCPPSPLLSPVSPMAVTGIVRKWSTLLGDHDRAEGLVSTPLSQEATKRPRCADTGAPGSSSSAGAHGAYGGGAAVGAAGVAPGANGHACCPQQVRKQAQQAQSLQRPQQLAMQPPQQVPQRDQQQGLRSPPQQAGEQSQQQMQAAQQASDALPAGSEQTTPPQPAPSRDTPCGLRICADACASANTPEPTPVGVNGMLVRSLGWVQLPTHKEKMVEDVTSALTELGATFSIEHGELSDVVQATLPTQETTDDSVACAEGKLTVRMRILGDDRYGSDLHIERESGNVLQFHSFYRDVRNQLAGANGWSEELGRYHCVADARS